MSNENLPHIKLANSFKENWDKDLETAYVGKTLNILSRNLGVVIAELTSRGIPWEVIDRNINKYTINGVELYYAENKEKE